MKIDHYTIYHIDRMFENSAFTNKPSEPRALFFTNITPKIGESIQGIEIYQLENESMEDATYRMLTKHPNWLNFNYQKIVSLELIKDRLGTKSYKAIVEDVRLIKKRAQINIISEESVLLFKHLTH